MTKNILLISFISALIAFILVLGLQMANLLNTPLSAAIGAGIGAASAVFMLHIIKKRRK